MIVDKGQLNDINYWIVERELGTSKWYCAYIEQPLDAAEDEWEQVGFEPHGGITFDDYHDELETHVWGWDYNHFYDYDEVNMTTKLALLDTEKVIEKIRIDVKEYVEKVCEYIQNNERER